MSGENCVEYENVMFSASEAETIMRDLKEERDTARAQAAAAWRQLIYRGSGIESVPAELRADVNALLDADAEVIRQREAARRIGGKR